MKLIKEFSFPLVQQKCPERLVMLPGVHVLMMIQKENIQGEVATLWFMYFPFSAVLSEYYFTALEVNSIVLVEQTSSRPLQLLVFCSSGCLTMDL